MVLDCLSVAAPRTRGSLGTDGLDIVVDDGTADRGGSPLQKVLMVSMFLSIAGPQTGIPH